MVSTTSFRPLVVTLTLTACAPRGMVTSITPATPEPVPDAKARRPAPEPQAETAAAAASAAPDPLFAREPPSRCPVGMALILGEVCIDRWESSLVVVDGEGNEVAWSPFESPQKAKTRVRSVSRPGVVPQGYVSGDEADAACHASGKRLCTAREWEAACRGRAQTLYPYGNVRRKRTCNDDGREKHPVAEVHQRLGLPLDRMWYEGMGHPLINQLDNTLRKTGELSACTNDVGAFDMVGNLHEWIDDPAGTFRGGFYMDTQINGEGCDYATTAHPKTYADYSTGFRCCAEADSIE